MKVIYTVAILGLIGILGFLHHTQSVNSKPSDGMKLLWNEWKAQYGAVYANDEEDDYRLSVFTQNYEMIQAHNAKGASYTMVVNKFANLTAEEFKTTYASCAGGVGGGTDCPSPSTCPTYPTPNLETQINWTMSGAVTAIKNQGQCGSCWAFSTTGALEGLYYLNHSILVSFSEQQLVSCAQNCYACDGCWPYLAMEYTEEAGLEPELVYPYTSGEGSVANCEYKKLAALNVNSGWQCVESGNQEQLIGALTQQPVSIAVEADQAAWQFYGGGVVNSECGDALDHAVLLVGWGPYQGESDFSYFVKNSWGTDWGMNGYIWIGATQADNNENGGNGLCGILSCAIIPTNN